MYISVHVQKCLSTLINYKVLKYRLSMTLLTKVWRFQMYVSDTDRVLKGKLNEKTCLEPPIIVEKIN